MSDSIEAAWDRLEALPRRKLRDLFATDDERVARLSKRLELPGGSILFDWSKTHLDEAHLAAFGELALACDFPERREALLNGEIVNPTEGRAAEHTAQRGLGSEESVEEVSQDLRDLEGLSPQLIATLAESGVHTRDDLADLAVDELTDITGQSAEEAKTLIMKAREHWFTGAAAAHE